MGDQTLTQQIEHNCRRLLDLFDGDRRRRAAGIAETAHALVEGMLFCAKSGGVIPPADMPELIRLLGRAIVEMRAHERKRLFDAFSRGGREALPTHQRLPDDSRLLAHVDAVHLDGEVARLLDLPLPVVPYGEFVKACRKHRKRRRERREKHT